MNLLVRCRICLYGIKVSPAAVRPWARSVGISPARRADPACCARPGGRARAGRPGGRGLFAYRHSRPAAMPTFVWCARARSPAVGAFPSARDRPRRAGPVKAAARWPPSSPDRGTGRRRWSMRWKPALNAFDIAFDGRLSAGRK